MKRGFWIILLRDIQWIHTFAWFQDAMIHSSKPQKIHLICAGLICVTFRNRLAPKTIQCLRSLHYHYAAEQRNSVSTRSSNADGRANRFATLSTDRLLQARDYYIIDSDSDIDF